MDEYIIWLIIMVFFLIFEAITMGLTTIWFAMGAFVAMLLALFDLPVIVQIATFLVVSVASLVFVYPIVKNKFKIGKEKTNFEALAGKTGVVVEKIDNTAGTGQVKVGGQIWSARTVSGKELPEGTQIRIVNITGVKAEVEELIKGEE